MVSSALVTVAGSLHSSSTWYLCASIARGLSPSCSASPNEPILLSSPSTLAKNIISRQQASTCSDVPSQAPGPEAPPLAWCSLPATETGSGSSPLHRRLGVSRSRGSSREPQDPLVYMGFPQWVSHPSWSLGPGPGEVRAYLEHVPALSRASLSRSAPEPRWTPQAPGSSGDPAGTRGLQQRRRRQALLPQARAGEPRGVSRLHTRPLPAAGPRDRSLELVSALVLSFLAG